MNYLQQFLGHFQGADSAVGHGPYPDLLPFLQVLTTPGKYRQLTERGLWWHRYNAPPTDPYWSIVPHYHYAECPFCHIRYREPADTYVLDNWGSYELRKALYVIPQHYPVMPRCPHFLGLHEFVNLHGYSLPDVRYWANQTGEIPYITPWFFPADLVGYAVLHALPICRIEGDQFVPRYTVFTLTYFSENPELVLQRHYTAEAARGKGDPEYDPITVYPAGSNNRAIYDLTAWATRGQLGWLDVSHPELPLQIGSGLQLPALYRNIQGRKRPYTWRNGRIGIA